MIGLTNGQWSPEAWCAYSISYYTVHAYFSLEFITQTGARWREHRKFMLGELSALGVADPVRVEAIVNEEAQECGDNIARAAREASSGSEILYVFYIRVDRSAYNLIHSWTYDT